MTPPRVTITIDELLVDGGSLGKGEDVEAAVRAELDAQRVPVETGRVAAAVASTVEAETGS